MFSWFQFMIQDQIGVYSKSGIIIALFLYNKQIENMVQRRFEQFTGIMKTHLITKLVYLDYTMLTRSWGPLSDVQVRILMQVTVFPQLRVKVSKIWIENFEKLLKVTGPHNFDIWLIFDVDSDGLVEIPKFKLFKFYRNKV